MKKKTRVAGIIETPHGVLLAQDRQDKYVQKSIDDIKHNNHKNSIQIQRAIEILKDGRYCLPGGKMEPGEEPEEALIRELNEELSVFVQPQHVIKIMEIVGDTRNHLIYLVKAEGIVMLSERELTGVGLLKKQNVLPMNHDFFQTHVIKVYERYIKNNPDREQLLPGFVSSLYFNKGLLEDWVRDEVNAYHYRSPDRMRAKKIPIPALPQSMPNFNYLDSELNPESVPQLARLLTRSAAAQVIPTEKSTKPKDDKHH